MYYCTLYLTNSRKNETNIWSCYSYASESQAQTFLDWVLDRARDCGATVEMVNNYYYITGQLAISTGSAFVKGTPSSQVKYYIIGIETKETLGSLDPSREKNAISVIDGIRAEKIMADWREKANKYKATKQKKINDNLRRFSDELDTVTDLKDIIRLAIKYSKQDIDKEKLIDITVQKIQGKSKSTKNSDWYDELSDINN